MMPPAGIEAAGGGPALLVGHALGQAVARIVAATHPSMVRAVVLLAAGGKVVLSEPAVSAAFRDVFDESLSPMRYLDRSCPPSKARTIDPPNEFQIRGWPDCLHFDAEVEQLEGSVLDGGELRVEDEARLRGAVHGHDIAGHGGEVGEEGAEAVDRQAVVGAAVAGLAL